MHSMATTLSESGSIHVGEPGASMLGPFGS